MYLDLSNEAAVFLYLEGGVVATRPAHVPGRGSGGYKASPSTRKWERWLQGQSSYLEERVVATRPAHVPYLEGGVVATSQPMYRT
jgi:hypothetical protein